MISRTISRFGQIRKPTELAAHEDVKKNPYRLTMGKKMSPFLSAVYDPIFIILVGNEDMHKSLNEFKFSQDPTTDCRVSCP